MVSAEAFRKLGDILPLLHVSTPKLPWLFFIVCKAHLSAPAASPLAVVSAFHLLLASLVEARLVRSSNPLQALCAATNAVEEEVNRFRAALLAALPPSITSLLPLHPGAIEKATSALDHEYSALLATASRRLAPDERLLLDTSHHLPALSPPVTPPADRAAPSTPIRSPRKRRIPQEALHTPRTRADILREKMSLTPRQNRFSRFMTSSKEANALDALAAVASSAPQSPAVSTRKAHMPSTPMSAGCAAVRWLQKLADTRPETADEFKCMECGAREVKTTDAMMKIVESDRVWWEIVDFARNLSDKLTQALPSLSGKDRKREAMAVFCASFEHILVRETSRLKDKPKWVVENLVRATSIRKSLLLCAWEVTVAAYGRQDMTMFMTAIKIFEVPPLDFVKAIESFARLRDLPKYLANHIVVCGNRVLDSLAWKEGSELVNHLRQRAQDKALLRSSPLSAAKEDEANDRTDEAISKSEQSGKDTPKNAVREFTLEFFFRKMLSVASERAQDLLMRLSMDAVAEFVWAAIKHAVWEKWHLMVDRHLDQIIMCCVYGVAKVRRYDLKFREIIQMYQSMPHVHDPSFTDLVPALYRDVCLDPHLNLMSTSETFAESDEKSKIKGTRGDIIKLYNQVFIPAMKAYILHFQVTADSTAEVSKVKSLINAGGTLPHPGKNLSSSHVLSASKSISSSGVGSNRIDEFKRDNSKDELNEKLMNSPMRALKPYASPRRIGRVLVSPMSPGGRTLAALRQSPGRRALSNVMGGMTPSTRKLYAFGESPVKNLDVNNQFSTGNSGRTTNNGSGKVRRAVPLSFEGSGVSKRTASMRQKFADVLSRKPSLKSQIGPVRLASSSDGTSSPGSGSDVMSKSNGIDT